MHYVMTSHMYRSLLLAIFICPIAHIGVAAGPSDFVGNYTCHYRDARNKLQRTGRLSIIQTGDHIEVNRTWDDERGFSQESNIYPLDGQEAPYTSAGGAKGRGRIELKGEYLSVKTAIVVRPDPSQPPVVIQETLRMELSKDLKTLVVSTKTHFPNMPLLDLTDTDKYIRD